MFSTLSLWCCSLCASLLTMIRSSQIVLRKRPQILNSTRIFEDRPETWTPQSKATAMLFHTPPEVLLRQCLRSEKTKRQAGALVLSPCTSQKRHYRAAVVNQLGQPMTVQSMSAPRALKGSEILISTYAAGINFADILMCKGQYQVKQEPPFVPGTEVAGKVVEVGTDVKSFKVGDRVVAISKDGGGFAEMCIVDSMGVFLVPGNLGLTEAAATSVCYGTTMMGITRNAKLKKGEKVLVTAAAGGTGLAAVDIAKNMYDCEVIGVCGGEDKCQFLKLRGVNHVIDYRAEKIRDSVKKITGGKGVDVAVDQVGGDTLLDCVKSLGFEGRALTVGYASGNIPKIPANLLLLKSSSLVGVFWGSYAQLKPAAWIESIKQVLQAVADGKIKPYVGKTFPLDQINQAFEYILSRKNVGKTVIKIKEEH